MLNISFLACTKVELCYLKVCIAVNGEKFQSRVMTLTLVRQCPLVRIIFIFYNVFKFHVPRSISYGAKTHSETHRRTHTHTDAYKDSDEYSIVVFCKNSSCFSCLGILY